MKIKSIKAAGITHPAAFGKAGGPKRVLAETADASNPLSRYLDHKSQGAKYQPPWSDVVCIVTAQDGTWGMGMSRHCAPVVPIINDYFSPLLEGEPVMATEKHYDMMVRVSSAHMGACGIASYAISAVDLALWDLKGKLLNKPVYELLGGPAREKIYCYATGHDFDWFQQLGFKAIKIWNLHGASGGLDALEKNEAMVAATREELGPGFEIMLDMWAIHDITFTVELAERLRPYRLKWLEDFLLPDHSKGYEEVRRRLPWQTLAGGERWYTHIPFQRAAEDRVLDIFQPDVQWVGGVTATMKVNAIAESAGIEIAMHAGCNDSYGQHMCYALPNNLWGEFNIDSAVGVPLIDGYRPTPGMAIPQDGFLIPNDAPGFGLEIDLPTINSSTSM